MKSTFTYSSSGNQAYWPLRGGFSGNDPRATHRSGLRRLRNLFSALVLQLTTSSDPFI